MSDGDEEAPDETVEEPGDDSGGESPETEPEDDGQHAAEDSTDESPDEPTGGDSTTDDEDEPADDEDEPAEDGDEPAEDGDEKDAEADDEPAENEADDEPTDEIVDDLDDRLDGIELDIENAATESDLDDLDDRLDEAEAAIEDANLPEPDEDDEDAADPSDELESRVTELRDAVENKRGPYADDAISDVESAQSTITGTRWTENGRPAVVTAVESFLDTAGGILDTEFSVETDDPDEAATALDGVVETIEERDLDPDEDEGTIADLLDATAALAEDLDDAEEWDDLSVRQKLSVEGFYDVLSPENKKDFPPEWNAIKIYEKRNEPEPILMGLDMFGSEFIEGHCIESLKRMGSPEAFDAMEQRAQRRGKPPIEVLGKIGDDRALDTLHDYIEGDSDPGLQKVTLKAIGEIGSTESTQPVADRLVAENDTVRSNAARALGLIGDTRAITPLTDVLDDDDSNAVRASAAWALNQIGTETALSAAGDHADDRSFLVQTEAEKATDAMADGTDAEDTAETSA